MKAAAVRFWWRVNGAFGVVKVSSEGFPAVEGKSRMKLERRVEGMW